MKYLLPLLLLILLSCHDEQTTEVTLDVAIHIKDNNHTTPLLVVFENNSKNARSFKWTFEGGEPAASDIKNPVPVLFTEVGEHTITLEAWNDGHRDIKTYTVRVDNAVTAAFIATEDVNNYAPATFNIVNQSVGGTSYLWSFEGGQPASYEGENPPAIVYNEPGEYLIKLAAGNGSATFEAEQIIEVRESMSAAFSIVPSFEDEDDMEAPLRATFDAKLEGIESIKWECAGATITNPTSKDASILFPLAGTYTVNLIASNDKQTKTVSEKIVVKENTNLRTHRDVRLGINTAQNSIGVFYSTKLRRMISNIELEEFGSMVDVAFFGLNDQFSFNKFVSPTALDETSLAEIPNPSSTKFINRTELGTVSLSASDFNSMSTDILLKDLKIKEQSYGDEDFNASVLPRIILFETQDHRKGAILVKEFVRDGRNSHIIVDIKVQKND